MKKLILVSAIIILTAKSCEINNNNSLTTFHKGETTSKHYERKVTATMYYAVVGQCDDTPLITACGYKINPKRASKQKWIAVSRDLLKIFKYGDKVRLSNAGKKNGIYTIADTMNKRFKNKIDILETENTPIYKLSDVVITKV